MKLDKNVTTYKWFLFPSLLQKKTENPSNLNPKSEEEQLKKKIWSKKKLI